MQGIFEENLVKWVVDTVLPFSSFEQKSFTRMVQVLNPILTVPSRQKTQRLITAKQISLHERLRSYIISSAQSVSLPCDAWSSRVYKGYMVVTIHWIDQDWNMRNTILDFIRFKTPHTGEASYSVLLDTVKTWNLERLVYSITTDNATDIVKGVKLLRKHLYKTYSMESHRPDGNFHVKCLAHVLNLAVKECMGLIHDKITKIRKLIGCLQCSVKRKDVFNDVKVELGLRLELPGLDVDTRWSFTFNMIRKRYAASRVPSAVVTRQENLADLLVSESKWRLVKKVCRFLEAPASATEHLSGSNYVTIPVTGNFLTSLKLRAKNTLKQRTQY